MKKHQLIIVTILGIFFWGCATSGQKFIDLSYRADHEKTQTGKIGIATVQDNRQRTEKGYIGYRILLDKSKETYFVKSLNLGGALTRALKIYYEKNGFEVTYIDPWEHTTGGVITSSKGFEQILSGTINQFECRAEKKGPATHMVFDINLTLYLGIADKKTLKTIPVSLTLERTELTFSEKKLEQFVNQALQEVIQKTLTL